MKAKLFVMMVLASVALVSCQNDDYEFGDNRPARPGDEIVFGGRMEYKSTRTDNTRTVYGDKGNTGTEIKWYQGDMVRIYCAEANLGENGGDQKYCDYQVTDFITALGGNNSNPIDGKYETNHSTGLRTPDGSTGLCWGTGAHDFYALYPSPAMLNKNGEDNVVVNSLKIEGKTVTAYLPNLQAPSAFVAPTTDAESKNKHYTIHPAMRYAYMVASATGKQPTDNNNVSLTFNPIITAVEMTIVNGGNATIEGVQMVSLSSENTICGEFSVEDVSVDVKDMTIKHSSSGDSYNIVSVPVAETGKTIDLNPGDTLTFTAFLALNADLNKITTTIVYANGVATRKATLTGNNGVNIVQAKKKNFITKLDANFSKAVSKVELNQWMASISNTSDDATPRTLASLSIPAAGGAASGHTTSTDWDKNEKYLEQKLTIEELWDQGIRCFEFTVDNADDFGGQKVYCNSKPSNITLTEAVNKVKSKLIANPTEFAMVIITYQNNNGWADRGETEGGVVAKNRDPEKFMTKLNTFWSGITFNPTDITTNTIDGQTTITFGKLLYSPTTNLGNARGKLFCIARPTSQGEDNYPEITTATDNAYLVAGKYTYISKTTINNSLTSVTPNGDILVINGWGALKDKWEARGFTTSPYKRGRGNDNYNAAEESPAAKDNRPGRPFDASRQILTEGLWSTLSSYEGGTSKITLTPNFTYSTSSGVNAWVQEWARVIKKNETFEITPSGEGVDGYGQYVQWIESFTEKKNHITQTLDDALGKKKGDIIYINSLCGYYAEINGNDKNSILPNELTDMSLGNTIAKWPNEDRKRYSPVTASSATAGMCGNISDYAYDINNYFYNYLLKKSLNGKSTGIIMMDRVSNDATANPAGYYIPRIILANNPFAVGAITDPASVPVLDEIFEPNTDMPTSPKSQENKISVSWD